MTTLLTLTAMFSAVRQNVPKVSYISYLDIWMLTCMMFVFSCIMEFIVVTALTKFGQKKNGERVSDFKTNMYKFFKYFICDPSLPPADYGEYLRSKDLLKLPYLYPE